MADGSTKPIEEVEPGDRVVATDPETGRTEVETVTAAITGDGVKHLVTITVDTDGDQSTETADVTATDGHPFWVVDLGEWVDATDLNPGQRLRTSAGTHVQITAITRHTQRATVHNLTTANTHTYHALAGNEPILVHNCGSGDSDDLIHISRAAQRGNGADELTSGLNSARYAGDNGYAYVGTEDVVQKYADYSVGTHEDCYTKFMFKRSEFEKYFGKGLLCEGGPGLEWEIPP
ncbi:polymorphic toxin-type HINT domain-containing protein [Micromonospora sp. SH-82]